MPVITIPTREMKASSFFMAKNDIRHYLNGACIELTQDGARLVTTDGYCMLVQRIDGEPGSGQYVIPADVVNECARSHARGTDFTLELPEQDSRAGSRLFRTIECEFLDWRRVVPGSPRDLRELLSAYRQDMVSTSDPDLHAEFTSSLLRAMRPAQFDIDLAAKIKKAYRIFAARANPVLLHGGVGSPLVSVLPNGGIAVLMPLNGDSDPASYVEALKMIMGGER